MLEISSSMSFIKSAFDFVSNVTSDQSFVGSNIDLGNQNLFVNRVVAEGLLFI